MVFCDEESSRPQVGLSQWSAGGRPLAVGGQPTTAAAGLRAVGGCWALRSHDFAHSFESALCLSRDHRVPARSAPGLSRARSGRRFKGVATL